MLRELEHVTLNQLLVAIAKNVVKQKAGKMSGTDQKAKKGGQHDSGPSSSNNPH